MGPFGVEIGGAHHPFVDLVEISISNSFWNGFDVFHFLDEEIGFGFDHEEAGPDRRPRLPCYRPKDTFLYCCWTWQL